MKKKLFWKYIIKHFFKNYSTNKNNKEYINTNK